MTTAGRVALLLALAACTSPRPSGPALSPSVSPEPSASPSAPQTFRFAVIGDWGAGTREQRAIADRMCTVRKTRPFEVVVTAGDNFYGPDGTATARNYSGPSRCLLDGRVVWRATWGNHDLAGRSTATVLGAKERWYSWRGGDAEFFMLDSNSSRNAAQRQWLEGALQRSTAFVKVAVFHHPPYTGGYHTNDRNVQQTWVPLFRRYDVTLVITGHNHAYERSLVDGIDYVISGGGGAPVYPCVSRPVTMLICRPVHHFLIVEVAGKRVDVTAVTAGGESLDRFSVEAA